MAIEARGNGGVRIETDGKADTAGIKAGKAPPAVSVSVPSTCARSPLTERRWTQGRSGTPLPRATTRRRSTLRRPTTVRTQRQHKEPTYHHREGGPKHAESALTSERDTVTRLVQAQIRRALGT
jgi:hypothetical protein